MSFFVAKKPINVIMKVELVEKDQNDSEGSEVTVASGFFKIDANESIKNILTDFVDKLNEIAIKGKFALNAPEIVWYNETFNDLKDSNLKLLFDCDLYFILNSREFEKSVDHYTLAVTMYEVNDIHEDIVKFAQHGTLIEGTSSPAVKTDKITINKCIEDHKAFCLQNKEKKKDYKKFDWKNPGNHNPIEMFLRDMFEPDPDHHNAETVDTVYKMLPEELKAKYSDCVDLKAFMDSLYKKYHVKNIYFIRLKMLQ